MKGTDWTAGPWERGMGCVIFAADGEPVARVDEERPSEEEAATEHLIAAAPELYEALAIAVKDGPAGYKEWIDYAEDVLAKARGERS